MNTISLQENFSETYRDFFSRNDLVVSGCYTFPWGPMGGKHISHSIRVKSKIPLKCYVGFNKNNSGKITFSSTEFFDIVEKKFISYDFKSVIKELPGILELLNTFLEENNISQGCEISILSETPRGHSFGFSGTMFAILSAGLFDFFDIIDNKLLENNDDFINSKFKNDIFCLALSLELKSRYGNTIGQSILSTMGNYSEPTILISEKYDKNIKKEEIPEIYRKHIPLMSSVENTVTHDCTFDYFMIFPGISGDTKQVEQFKKADNSSLNNYKESLQDLLSSQEINNKNIYLKEFFDKNIDIYDHIADTIGILNLKTIKLFQKIAKNGYREDIIEDFIYHINQYRYTLSLLENQNPFAEDLIYFFRKNKSNFNESIGIMPTASGKIGGGYVVVTKPGISRITVDKAIKELSTLYPSTQLEYCSYLDGNSNDGIIVEQFVNKGLFSKYINKDEFLFTDNMQNNYICSYNEIFKKEKKGIILDTIKNKIYLDGKKLTSKDIHSQNTTIEVLLLLLKKPGSKVSNKELSVSSYSNNKNEMFGKIIFPFIKFIEQKIDLKLPLECKGSITDYYLKMEKINIKVGIVTRIK